MRRAWLVAAVAAIAGCGRIGFDPIGAHSVLRLDGYDPGELLSGFPIALVLDGSRVALDVMAPDASDLRVYDDTGAVLPIEIEQVGPPYIVWVRVPQIEGTTTTLTLGYGDPGAPLATSPMWSTAYEGVWHFSGDTHDSTGRHVATVIGTSPGDGYRGSGRGFDDAAMDAMVIDDTASLELQTPTLSGFVYVRSMAQNYSSLISRELDGVAADDVYLGVKTGQVSAVLNTTLGEVDLVMGNVSFGTWHHIAMTYNGVNVATFLDGALVESLPFNGTPIHSGNPMMIGANRNNNDASNQNDVPDTDFLDGQIDELRIENVARSAAWIAAEQYAIGDAWVTYGPIER